MKYFIISGEASGDLHAANLVKRLRQADTEAKVWAMGGENTEKAGAQLVRHYRDMAFMGVINVVLHMATVRENFRIAHEVLTTHKPDALILVDYPSFNLKIAQYVKEHHLPTRVIYYISPKLWAWKSYRIKDIKRYVDQMLVIFPFEVEYYAQRGYQVRYVGNPLNDSIEQWRATPHDNYDGKPYIALLPGSRTQEIRGCLPRMIEAAKAFAATHDIVIAGAPGQDIALYQDMAQGIKVVFDDTYTLLSHADAAVVNSGTATLETALIGCPQVVVYNIALPHLASLVKPYIIKTRYISLVNIIAGKEVVRELVAADFRTDKISAELDMLLHSAERREAIAAGYTVIRDLLGETQASENAAKEILNFIGQSKKKS